MFVARLKNMQKTEQWLTIAATLALLSDCDRLALRDEVAPQTLTITRDQIVAALLSWTNEHRAGQTRSAEETDALPAFQVAEESAATLWLKLGQ